MITSLSLQQFRNFTDTTFTDFPQVTVIDGPNGVGKTNILEALALIHGSPWKRYRRLQEIVQWEQPYAAATVAISDQDIQTVRAVIKNNKVQYVCDDHVQPIHAVQSRMVAMVFTPDDVTLFSGEPDVRRRFLDTILIALLPEYAEAHAQYGKVLKRRNAALRQQERSQLAVWEEQLAESASVVYLARQWVVQQLVTEIQLQATGEYIPSPRSIAPYLLFDTDVREMLQKNAGNVQEIMREKWEKLREKELAVGFSLMGPQRDDWRLQIVFKNAGNVQESMRAIDVGTYGSRGQERLAVIRMQLAGLRLLSGDADLSPIWLLDDVFSELDAEHQAFVVDACQKYQTFITTTNKDYEGIQALEQLPNTQTITLGSISN